MAKNATREMTSGSPLKLILSFAVPLLLGMLFQQFYSMVDTIIVGKSLGVDQLAGVGSTGAINFMIIGFCNGVCSGFAIPIAQSFGAKDYKRLRKFVANAAWLFHRIRSCYDSCRLCTMQTNSFMDGYTRKYFRICL